MLLENEDVAEKPFVDVSVNDVDGDITKSSEADQVTVSEAVFDGLVFDRRERDPETESDDN
jgi:hypothetical protein